MGAGTKLAATELLIALLKHTMNLSVILHSAQAEDRELTDDEWSDILVANTAAMDRLEDEIAKARSEGR